MCARLTGSVMPVNAAVRGYSSLPPIPARRSAAWKPIFECVPSQNGLVVDAPQRQSAIRFFAGYDFPSLSFNATSPFTISGPFLMISIVTSAISNGD